MSKHLAQLNAFLDEALGEYLRLEAGQSRRM
jgi:hypothetical protein